jgi:hypothetical protein
VVGRFVEQLWLETAVCAGRRALPAVVITLTTLTTGVVAAKDRRRLVVEATAGCVGFADDSIISETLVASQVACISLRAASGQISPTSTGRTTVISSSLGT